MALTIKTMKKLLLTILFCCLCAPAFAQSDLEQIQETLTDYIEGTAGTDAERLREAFHPDFNLYTVNDDSLRVIDGQKYIVFETKEKSNHTGRIISIDHEQDAAIAKVEILTPGSGVYYDYFLLLKLDDKWKIIQKSYTGRPFYNADN
jgi:hypothetical protein